MYAGIGKSLQPRAPGPAASRSGGTSITAGAPDWENSTPGSAAAHYVRNVLARVPKGSAEMVVATIRTVLAQRDATAVGPS